MATSGNDSQNAWERVAKKSKTSDIKQQGMATKCNMQYGTRMCILMTKKRFWVNTAPCSYDSIAYALGNLTWQRFWMKENYHNNKEFKIKRIVPSKIDMRSFWRLVSKCVSFLLRLFLYRKNMVSTKILPFSLSPKKQK